MKKPKLIFYNDSRHYSMYRYDPPMSLHQLQQPVDEILGTGVDTLSFGLASGDTYLHDSKVGLKWGEKVKNHNSGVMWWRAWKNLMEALEAGHDPLKVVVDRAHEKGLQLICSIRINVGSSPTGANLYTVGKLKYEHPELMIGEEYPGDPSADAYDFAHAAVREERLAIIEEVVDRYGADGIELDSTSAFFKPSQARVNTPILTGFIRDVRNLLDRIGRERGEELMLAVHVHSFEEANLAIGMDVRALLSDNLVNLVIPDGGDTERGFLDTSPYAEWLIEAAHDAGAWVYSTVGRVPYDDRYHLPTVDMYRAAASTYRRTGFDGLYLGHLPWPHTASEYEVLREMGDPDIYARKSKHYILGPKGPDAKEFSLDRYLPVNLEVGVPVRIPVYVGDALESARNDNELEEVTLGVRIVQTGMEDTLSFRINGNELSAGDAKISTYYGGIVSYGASRSGLPVRINTHYWFEFELPPGLVREGDNEVEVTLEERLEERVEDRVLESLELRIVYKEPPLPIGGQA